MGPLRDMKVIEIGGMAPGAFCGMMLADMGARVLGIERPGLGGPGTTGTRFDIVKRGARSSRST
jgi:crotonobetainyl-CoA:carnitine CoA-transferase CaiB-like acyl-CoA transferase